MCDRKAEARESNSRKMSAFAALEARRDMLILQARRAFLRVLLLGAKIVTADDIRTDLDLPDETDARYLGAVPGPLARAGIIRRTGYRNSTRPEAHARPIATWELADREAALRWLANHPDPNEIRTEPAGDAEQGLLF